MEVWRRLGKEKWIAVEENEMLESYQYSFALGSNSEAWLEKKKDRPRPRGDSITEVGKLYFDVNFWSREGVSDFQSMICLENNTLNVSQKIPITFADSFK